MGLLRVFPAMAVVAAWVCLAGISANPQDDYRTLYTQRIDALGGELKALARAIEGTATPPDSAPGAVHRRLIACRTTMKEADFWLRYLDPLSQKRINGPLPVEWETEVFEKFEKPYRRVGAGLTLLALYLEEPRARKDSALALVEAAIAGLGSYRADSTTAPLGKPDHFYLCNRLFLLNLATIYTTGFECPHPERTIPEMRDMMAAVQDIHSAFNAAHPTLALPAEYLDRYRAALQYVERADGDLTRFDHFTFLKEHVGPLFAMNQHLIRRNGVRSRSYMDYSLSNSAEGLFDKRLYAGQDAKGVFRRVDDPVALEELRKLGEVLFFDPVLSGNGERSCASCHKPGLCFTDGVTTAISFDKSGRLERNTPTLVNADLNHLLMLDGVHISLQDQARAVITDPREMGADPGAVLDRVMSVPDHRRALQRSLQHTPQFNEVRLDHVLGALTIYVTSFSGGRAPFDDAIEGRASVDPDTKAGFNLFMGKAQCATCHFVPQFNGVKPPYIGSEFEVVGTPADTAYTQLSNDVGRYAVNPAPETLHAFRTGGLRNIVRTAPYMHNGVFRTLEQVLEFYNHGGGAGHGLAVDNQTLSSDSLHLTPAEQQQVITFLRSLNEDMPAAAVPSVLPKSSDPTLKTRVPGGTY